MVKPAVLLIASMAVSQLSGCAVRGVNALKESEERLTVIARQPGYTILRKSPTSFFIVGDSTAKAEQGAFVELNCDKRPCAIAPSGVILIVERPEYTKPTRTKKPLD